MTYHDPFELLSRGRPADLDRRVEPGENPALDALLQEVTMTHEHTHDSAADDTNDGVLPITPNRRAQRPVVWWAVAAAAVVAIVGAVAIMRTRSVDSGVALSGSTPTSVGSVTTAVDSGTSSSSPATAATSSVPSATASEQTTDSSPATTIESVPAKSVVAPATTDADGPTSEFDQPYWTLAPIGDDWVLTNAVVSGDGNIGEVHTHFNDAGRVDLVLDVAVGESHFPPADGFPSEPAVIDGHEVTMYTISRGTYHVVFTSLPLEAIIQITIGDDLEGALNLMHVVQMDHFVPPSGTLPVETIPF